MASSIARISVNGIEIGSLPADTYFEIVDSARRDFRLYLVWGLRASTMLLRNLVKFYCAIPGVIIGLFVITALVFPELFSQQLTELRSADSAAITQGLRDLVFLASSAGIFIMPMSALFAPRGWRFQSPFDAAISQKIRSLLEEPAEGELIVEITAQPGKFE